MLLVQDCSILQKIILNKSYLFSKRTNNLTVSGKMAKQNIYLTFLFLLRPKFDYNVKKRLCKKINSKMANSFEKSSYKDRNSIWKTLFSRLFGKKKRFIIYINILWLYYFFTMIKLNTFFPASKVYWFP